MIEAIMLKLFAVYVYLQSLFCGCLPDRVRSDFVRLRKEYNVEVERIGRLDGRISESSGFARATDSTFWTHADSGGPSVLYEFNLKGDLLRTVQLPIRNQDWEDLAQDRQGNLYIGDFGNNANARRNLRVYKVQPEAGQVSDTIRFNFADQQEFPPPREQRHFDLEAFFHYNNSLHLFTKSRALKGITQLYLLPAQHGSYSLPPQQELRVQSAVTAAAVSPEHTDFALLGYGRLYLFRLPGTASVSLNGSRYCLPLGRTGQAEALLYLSEEELLIGNENGKLYKVTFRKKKE